MPRLEATRRPRTRLPARRPVIVAPHRVPGRRVESQPGDHREGVTVPRVDRDPFTLAVRAEPPEIRRAHRRRDQPGGAERVGDGARAIVTRVSERTMTAAVAIRFRAELVRGPDGAFHFEGSAGGSSRDTTRE